MGETPILRGSRQSTFDSVYQGFSVGSIVFQKANRSNRAFALDVAAFSKAIRGI
jgi:hypothetical protein